VAEVGRIQIEVDARQVDKAVDSLNKMGVTAKKTGDDVKKYGRDTDKATTATNKMSKSSRRLTRTLGILGVGISGLTFGSVARQIEAATTQLNNIESTMKVAAGSSEAAGEQLAFIREEADRLGLFFPSVAKQMAQFSAAARGTSITSEELRTIFTGISEASRAMGLTAPETEGAMKALQQMMSKGKVSAEELRQQLGERMPGSIQIMASALGVTTERLFEMMENGELLSDEVLPKFGREMMDVFGPEAARQAERIAAAIQRLRTAFFDLMSQGDLTGAADAINRLATTISSPNFQRSFDALVQRISNFAGVVARNINVIGELMTVLAAGAAIKGVIALASAVTKLKSALMLLTGPTGAIVALVGALVSVRTEMMETRKEADRLAESFNSMTEAQLVNELEKALAEQRKLVADFDQTNPFAGPSPEDVNRQRELSVIIEEIRAALSRLRKESEEPVRIAITGGVVGGPFPRSDALLEYQEQQKKLLSIIKKTGTEGDRIYSDMERALRDVGDTIKDDVSDGLTDIILQAESARDVFAELAETIARAMTQRMVVDPLVGAATDFGSDFLSGLFSGGAGSQPIGGGAPPSVRGIGPARANGGNVYSNTAHLVGERGPEMFVPGQDGRIIPNNQMGGSANVTVNVINEGGQPLSVSSQNVKKNVNGDTNIDVMVKQSIDRLDSQGQLDGMFRRHGGTRTGQF